MQELEALARYVIDQVDRLVLFSPNVTGCVLKHTHMQKVTFTLNAINMKTVNIFFYLGIRYYNDISTVYKYSIFKERF